jgi:hypothetical protein
VMSTAPGAPAGETMVICVSLLTTRPVPGLAPKFTAVAPVKALPVIVTVSPPEALPLVGLMVLTNGNGVRMCEPDAAD